MRLTLRTLLAYMDDILEPQQAKEIGAKIAQSDFASTLSSRIKDVLRRRRILAPDVDGPGMKVDPNTVAEYLDNTLPPDAVADVERIFLESDVHLAEVAAAHQVLTLVMGEPVEISPDSRDRMYALGPEPAHDAELAAAMRGNGKKPAGGVEAEPAAKSQPAGSDGAKPAGFEVPAYLRRKPLWRRAFPYVAVLAVAVVFFGAVLTDSSLLSIFSGGSDGENASHKSARDQAGKTAPAGKTDRQVARKEGPAKKTDRILAKNGPPREFPPVVRGINPKPPPDEPENGNPPAGKRPKVVGKQPPVVPAQGPGAKAPKRAVAPKPRQAQTPEVVAGNAPPMKYVQPAGKGLLFRYQAKPAGGIAPDWFLVGADSRIRPGDRIAAVDPFDADIAIGDGNYRVKLLAGTSADVLPPSKAAIFGFDVRHGRLMVGPNADRGNAPPPKPEGAGPRKPQAAGLVLGVRVRGELFRVELLTPGTVCGIEVRPAVPDGFEKSLGANSWSGSLTVSAGSVRFADGKGGVVVVSAGENSAGRISLAPADRKSKQALAVEQGEVPSWMTPQARQRSATQTLYANRYLEEFPNDGVVVPGQKPVSMLDNVTAIVRDRRPYVSQYAVRALAVTESYAALVDALAVAAHEESRRAAIDGLRTWLGQAPGNGKKLKAELRKHFTEEDANAIYQLLWGYSESDARNVATSQRLVGWLVHDHLAVRELAFMHIRRLTNRTFDYHPNLLGTALTVTVNRWRNYLMKNDGALLPPKAAPGKNQDKGKPEKALPPQPVPLDR